MGYFYKLHFKLNNHPNLTLKTCLNSYRISLINLLSKVLFLYLEFLTNSKQKKIIHKVLSCQIS